MLYWWEIESTISIQYSKEPAGSVSLNSPNPSNESNREVVQIAVQLLSSISYCPHLCLIFQIVSLFHLNSLQRVSTSQ